MSVITNPFSDEHGIEMDERPRFLEEEATDLYPFLKEQQHTDLQRSHDGAMSDIYNATPLVRSPELARSHATLSPQPKPVAAEVLFDFDSHSQSNTRTEYSTAVEYGQQQQQREGTATSTSRSVTLERDFAEDEYMTAGQDDRSAYASIQAWAQNSSNPGFYSPLPVSPPAPVSEPELISEGQLTPTDSVSVVDVANDTVSSRGEYDVMSETDDGIPTPHSWSEVGSVISESESAARA
jgi:hypothetical protein